MPGARTFSQGAAKRLNLWSGQGVLIGLAPAGSSLDVKVSTAAHDSISNLRDAKHVQPLYGPDDVCLEIINFVNVV